MKKKLCKKRVLALVLSVSMIFTSADTYVLAAQTDVNLVSDEGNLISETSENEEVENEENSVGENGNIQPEESKAETDNMGGDGYTEETDKTEVVEEDKSLEGAETYYSDDASNIASGTYENITWEIDTVGKLTVNGTGEFSDIHGENRAPWYTYRDGIKSAEINITDITDDSYMFYGCKNLTSLDLSNFDTGKVENMSSLFDGCENLTNLDLSNFDTSKVKHMSYMFWNCENLTSLDLSNFDTSQVEDMAGMFGGCENITNLDLSNFDTSKVEDMDSMLIACINLTSLDLSNFDTSQVKNMYSMFRECINLTSLGLGNFNTSQVANMSGMFWNCVNLVSIDLSSFNTSRVTEMSDMFRGCSSLTTLDLSSFNLENCTNTFYMFSGCSSLNKIKTPCELNTAIELPEQDGEVWTEPDGKEIIELPQGLNTSIEIVKREKVIVPSDNIASGTYEKITWEIDTDGKLSVNGTSEFADSTERDRAPWYAYRKFIKSAEINVTDITDVSYMFYDCENLTSLDLSNFNTDKVVDMSYMFCGCTSLENLDLSAFNTSQVLDMSYMFDMYDEQIPIMTLPNTVYFSKLKSLDLSNFNTEQVKYMAGMFRCCDSLESLNISSFKTSQMTSMSYMFCGCINLNSLDLSSFDTSQVESMYMMFYNCIKLESLNISSFNTSQVTNMSYMFFCCSNLTDLDLSSFDTSKVTDMLRLVLGCSNLNKIKTPYNVTQSVMLPVKDNRLWYQPDGTEITELPKYLDASMEIIKREKVIAPDENITSGTYGNVTWVIDYNGKLTVEGTGEFADSYYEGWTYYRTLWYSYRYFIKTAEINLTDTTNASCMFFGCENLTSVKISNFDTSKVTNMDSMFSNCSSLTNLDFSGLDTSKVKNIGSMFYNCTSLTDLDLSSFNAEQVITNYGIIDMFGNCSGLSKIKTPYGLKETITLPTQAGEVWTDPDGKAIAELPKNLTSSITIIKTTGGNKPDDNPNPTPSDNTDSIYKDDDRINLNEIGGKVAEIRKTKTYDGTPYEPIVKVTITENGKNKTLTEGIDYKVTYKNNIEAGTDCSATVRGIGLYKGELSAVSFEIKAKPIKKLKIVTGSMSVNDTSSEVPIYIYDGSKLLTKGTDYTLSDTSSITAKASKGEKVTISGLGNYMGIATAKITVYEVTEDKIINVDNVILKDSDKIRTYTGKAIKDVEPEVKIGDTTLTKGKDYKITYQNNTNAGTAFVIVTGKGQYKGKVVQFFTITSNTQALSITNSIPDKTYNGKPQKPSVTVKSGNKKLKKNKDYTVYYVNNLHVGTATVRVTGIGNYAGTQSEPNTVETTFVIKPQKIKKVSVKGTKDNLIVMYNKRILKKDYDYTIEYGEENKNKIKITLTGCNNFTESVIKNVKIK